MGSVRLYAAALLLLAACCCLWQPTLGRPSSRPVLLQRLRRSAGIHYCGSQLTSMLEFVCGVTSSISIGKRPNTGSQPTATGNMHDFNGDRRPNELGSTVLANEFPIYSSRPRLLEKVDPLQGGGRRLEARSAHPGGPDRIRVKRQGIVYECCYNACSIPVLETYCNS